MNSFENLIMNLGKGTESLFTKILNIFNRFFSWIIGIIKSFGLKVKTYFDKLYLDSLRSSREEFSYLKKEVHSVKSNIRQAIKQNPKSVFSVMAHYVKKAYERHPKLFKRAFNVFVPLFACVALLITVNYWSSVTFALSVECNGQHLGYVSDETVYTEAQTLVEERLDTSGGESSTKELLDGATYKVVLVSPNELTDAQTISDKIVETADAEITQACGIYIDGDFICAVKNEMDAVQVFDVIKDQYETEDENDVIGFVEDVEYVQGLYDEEVVWDTEKLQEKLNTKKAEAVYYTVQDGDTPSGIAEQFDIKTSDFLAMNPGTEDVIHVGDKVLVSQEVNYVRIKVVKTVVVEEETAFETIKTNNSSMYKGTSKTTKYGKKGLDKVTKLLTYVDGIQVGTEEINRITIKEPSDQLVDVGTKSTYVTGNYSYSVPVRGSMVWPLVGCYTVSSPYGYRWGGFHGGIDLSNGHVYGNLVLAAASGTVSSTIYSGSGYGNHIIINHGGGLVTLYAHLSSISVSPGQYVNAGDAIGRAGSSGNSTGPHLHFEVRVNGSKVNPAPYIGAY